MVLIAKQKSFKSKLWIKEFDSVKDCAFYLKVHPVTIRRAAGVYTYCKPCKVKGWYVSIED